MDSADKLIIPKLCKVGFNLREDTFSGRLGYVIYKDAKSVWRKEKSWSDWIDRPDKYVSVRNKETGTWDRELMGERQDIVPLEFDNVPTEGFIFNKAAGGGRSGWSQRAKCARVYDPRGWEFEISIENLLYILQETDILKGKGIVGKCVYSWSGQNLVLLPCCASDFNSSVDHTNLQGEKIFKKDLVVGHTYRTRTGRDVVYLGDHYVWDCRSKYSVHIKGSSPESRKERRMMFKSLDGDKELASFEASRLARCVNPSIHGAMLEFMLELDNSVYKGKVGLDYQARYPNALKVREEYYYIVEHEYRGGSNRWSRASSPGIVYKVKFDDDCIQVEPASYDTVRGIKPDAGICILGQHSKIPITISHENKNY